MTTSRNRFHNLKERFFLPLFFAMFLCGCIDQYVEEGVNDATLSQQDYAALQAEYAHKRDEFLVALSLQQSDMLADPLVLGYFADVSPYVKDVEKGAERQRVKDLIQALASESDVQRKRAIRELTLLSKQQQKDPDSWLKEVIGPPNIVTKEPDGLGILESKHKQVRALIGLILGIQKVSPFLSSWEAVDPPGTGRSFSFSRSEIEGIDRSLDKAEQSLDALEMQVSFENPDNSDD